MLDDMVTRDYRLSFLEQAHPLRTQLRPIDLLNTEEGTAAVLQQLESAATGAFASTLSNAGGRASSRHRHA